MNSKPFSEEEFVSIYSKVPRLCVDLVIQTPQGIVFGLRNLEAWHNMWHLPGGTLFHGEKVKDAVKRIAQNELGISVTESKFIGYIEYIKDDNKPTYRHAVSIVYSCQVDSVPSTPTSEDSSEVKVFKKLPENIIPEQ